MVSATCCNCSEGSERGEERIAEENSTEDLPAELLARVGGETEVGVWYPGSQERGEQWSNEDSDSDAEDGLR